MTGATKTAPAGRVEAGAAVTQTPSPDGQVAVPLVPKRALTLAQELIEPAVSSIKIGQWGKPWPG